MSLFEQGLRAIGDRLGNLRLFPKYLFSHGLVVLLTALVIASVSFGVAKEEMEVYAQASARAILEQTGRILEKKDSDLQMNLVAQLEQAGIYRLLRQLRPGEGPMARLRLERQLAVMMSTNRWMRSILLAPLYGPELFLPAGGADGSAIRSFDPARVAALHGRAYWFTDEAGAVFFCKLVYDLETSAKLGILAIGIDADFFEGILAIDRYRGLGSLFIVSDDSRRLVYHTRADPALLGQVEAWVGANQAVPAQFRARGATYLASSRVTGNRNWEVIDVVSAGELTSLSSRTGALILEATLAVFAVSLSFAFLLLRSEVGKITKLAAQTHLIAAGNFELELGFRSRDELGELAAEISSMARELGELVERVANEKSQKAEAELRALRFEYSALQSSVNPHFIANTLELINSTAKLRGVPQIGEMACLLGDLLRESYRRKEALVSLREEVGHCRTYLKIQELLLESRLEVAYDIPEELLGRLVPNLILQPIVENAILHGIEPKIGSARVAIAARRRGEDLELRVEDDGVGIAPERLPELLAPRPGEPARKIGLESVDKRIKILFGPAYGIRIRSEHGSGTEVSLLVPADARQGS